MRISMSLPKKLLNEFDEVLKDRGYQSRSKGIRDALKDYIVRYQWMNEMEGTRIGIIAVIYAATFIPAFRHCKTSLKINFQYCSLYIHYVSYDIIL